MHASCLEFVKNNLKSEYIDNKNVIELGSYDINGTVRPIVDNFKPNIYLGSDISYHKTVDLVADVHYINKLFNENSVDLIISTEMLEHVADWKTVINNMKKILKIGGYLLLTTRSKGFKYHNAPDFWRFEYIDFEKIFSDMEILSLEKDKQVPGVFILAKKISKNITDLSNIKLFSMKRTEIENEVLKKMEIYKNFIDES